MSSVLVPCLIKVIHLQGHIPYVLCVAAPAFSGNGELKTAEKATADDKDYRKETLYNSKRSCYQGKRPLQRQAEIFFQPFGCILLQSQLEGRRSLGQHQRRRQQLLQGD